MYNSDNIFAKIIAGTIASKKIYEDDEMIVIHDIQPAAPIHVLLIPKGEYVSIEDFTSKADADVIARFFGKIPEIAKMLGIDRSGYRVITNKGPDANQTVQHFHVHILGGSVMGALV